MAAELVPIRLSVTAGDLYTIWAPRWTAQGQEWEAFLGEGDDLFAFESVADLTAFVRSNTHHDLSDHPAWDLLAKANAHKLQPAEERQVDLIAIEDLLAEKPTTESVTTLANALSMASSIGSACELPSVTRFFNGNPHLGLLSGGIEQFSGRAGRKRWNAIGETVGRTWDNVILAIDEVITTPEVDQHASQLAAKELDEPFEDESEPLAVESEEVDLDDETATDEAGTEDSEAEPVVEDAVLGGHEDFWSHVGIDPIRIMTTAGTFYTLRCYYDDRPIFLGRNGRISIFPSGRALARYLADEHDHDLSDLSTYDDIRTAATDGSLRVAVTEDNIYVLTGLTDDFAEGPEAVDKEQLELVVELLHDIGVYSEEDTVDKLLAEEHALGKLVSHVLDPDFTRRPGPPYAAAVKGWEQMEAFVESRLRRE